MDCGRSMLFIFGQRCKVENAVRADVLEFPEDMLALAGLKSSLLHFIEAALDTNSKSRSIGVA
jgi:hypothetical protein